MPALGYPSRMKGGHEKTPEVTTPTLPLGLCFVDQESGAHTTTPTNRNLNGFQGNCEHFVKLALNH